MASTDFDTSYNELMEHVSVTPEMRARVLAGVVAALEEESEPEAEEPVDEPRTGFRVFSGGLKPTHILGIAACLLLALVVGTVLLNRPSVETGTPGGEGPGDVAMYAPEELATAEELSEAVGVPVPYVPALDDVADEVTYVSLWGEIAEVCYELPEGSADLRISPEPGDNSGDYNAYPVEWETDLDGLEVMIKGDDEGYYLAYWDQDGHGVSVRFDYPVPLETLQSCVWSAIDAL